MNATDLLDEYLSDCRSLAVDEIRRMVPVTGGEIAPPYDLVLDYPLREGKALRPALCIAVCRALGGCLEAVLPSAAVLELYHNAFLIHDDVEDASETRRGGPTLFREHGVPIAINVGDSMLALALRPLLDNTRRLGLGKALRILEIVERMARESTEGQAIELAWIRGNRWDLRDADYIRMVHKKTGWYTFLAPASIGSLAADAGRATSLALRKYAALLGIAFQIQDDVLNLVGEGDRYGKEVAGDLWEGKHTLILLHAMRSASAHDRERAQAVLAKERPHPPATNGNGASAGGDGLAAILDRFVRSGEVSENARAAILAAGRAANGASGAGVKTPADVQLLIELIERAGSIPHARDVARDYATRALRALGEAAELEPSVHRDFLTELAHFVVSRDH